MYLNRRNFLELTACAGVPIVSGLQGCQPTPDKHRTFSHKSRVTLEELEKAAGTPILQLDGIDSPLQIQSIELLQKGRDYFVHVRSKDGAEGIALTNSRVEYLYPILKKLVVPYFIGKDARDLESHLFALYRYRSNYKLQGLALWCPLGWVEFAMLDMMGRVAGKSIGQLFGGVVRRRVGRARSSAYRCNQPRRHRAAGRVLQESPGLPFSLRLLV